jgi:tRNA pseudouridine55 synthase
MNSPRQQRGSSVKRRPVHGVLLLDKPIGLSSNQALQKAKWLLRAEKAGHTGTLDPLATGVLPLCFGAATKFSQMHLDADKAYVADVRLGVTTTTADAEGEVISTQAVPMLDQTALDAVASRFIGDIDQVPPMYSALKRDGKPLYEYAREGVTLEREPRRVRILDLQLSLTDDPATIRLRVTCTKGTYVRTLGEDVGAAIGCGAHLVSLRRTKTGGFSLDDQRAMHKPVSLVDLEAMDEDARLQALLPVESLLPHVATVTLASHDAGRFLSGVRLRGEAYEAPVELLSVWGEQPHAFLGSAHTAGSELIPTRLLSPLEVQQCLAQANSAAKDAALH